MNIKSLLGTFAFAASAIFAAPASALVITNNVDTPICDLCTINSTIDINAHFLIQDLNVLLNHLTHTFDGDLVISIFAPTGASVLLSNQRGGGGNNFQNTVFDDAAATTIASGSAPFNGTFRPDQALSAFNGIDAFGTWTLRIQDVQSRDNGSLRNWGLDITPAAPAAEIPEPAGLAIFGLGLLGLAASRRKAAKK